MSTIAHTAGYSPAAPKPQAFILTQWSYRAVVTITIALYILLSLALGRTRAPDADEALFADPALNLITNGSMGTRILETAGTPWKGMNQHTYWNPPLHMLAESAWYLVFGFSLWSLRALSAAWGLLALFAWWWIIKALFHDRYLALWVTLVIALDYAFLNAASMGRMDMMSASLGLAGIAAYLNLRELSLTRAVLVSQSCAVAAGLTHPVGGLLWWAALLLLTVYFDLRRLRFRHLMTALIPYVMGGIGWGIYIARSPSDFWAQFIGNIFVHDRLSGVTPWQAVGAQASAILFAYFGIASGSGVSDILKLGVPALYVAALVGAVFYREAQHRRGFRVVFALAVFSLAFITFADRGKHSQYLVHIFVCATALFAVCVYRLSQVSGSFRRVAAVLGGLFILLQVSRAVHTVALNAYEHEYASAGRYIREHSDPNSLIMGSSELAFVLGFSPNLIDDPSLGAHTGKVPSFFVYSDRYAMYFSRFQSRQPDVYEHVKTSLDQQYERVFEGPKYSVFALRNVSSSTSPGYVGKLTPNTLTQGKEAGERRLE